MKVKFSILQTIGTYSKISQMLVWKQGYSKLKVCTGILTSEYINLQLT